MTKLLVCGDLHTKFNVLERVKELAKAYDRVIFLGDYVDEWNTVSEASYNILTDLIEYKKANPDKVILLLGNHDLSEWEPDLFECSGFNNYTHYLVKDLYTDNVELFKVAHHENDLLFSHAGFTTGWVRDLEFLPISVKKPKTAKEFDDLMIKTLLKKTYDKEAKYIWSALGTAGPARGGWHSPSPMWADYSELIANPVPKITQIVGHTPQREIVKHAFKNGDGTSNYLYFCDTHSKYPDGTPYGNGDLLSINLKTGTFEYIPLDN